MTNKYTLEFMAERVVAYKYAQVVSIRYDAGDWIVEWGELPWEEDKWCSVRDSTLRGVLEEAYHGMYES